jgi:CBS-domain-containing membrane protein
MRWLRGRPWRAALFAAAGAFATIGILAAADATHMAPLIIAPFGASCALVFGAPASPLARPRNVIGGHLISTVVGLLAAAVITSPILAMAAGVGLAIAGMLLTETLHPPAGANPIVVVLSHATWGFLLAPVLAGTLAIVTIGMIYHRMVTGHDYAHP